MQNAFEGACWNGHLGVVEFLLDRGIDPGSTNNGGETGLHAAASFSRADVIRVLLDRGCPVHLKQKSYNATALDFALWAWQNASDRQVRERSYEVVALLARAGAKFDPQHWTDPDTGASPMVSKINADPRMQAALRRETAQ